MSLPRRIAALADLPFDSAQRDFESLVNRLFNGRPSGPFAPYAVDVREDGDHIYVEAELPGFTKEDIEITMENSTLTISAERKTEKKDPQNGDYLLNERRFARFLRSFTLPPTVDGSTVQANLKEGVLVITLNKREETKARKIQVS